MPSKKPTRQGSALCSKCGYYFDKRGLANHMQTCGTDLKIEPPAPITTKQLGRATESLLDNILWWLSWGWYLIPSATMTSLLFYSILVWPITIFVLYNAFSGPVSFLWNLVKYVWAFFSWVVRMLYRGND